MLVGATGQGTRLLRDDAEEPLPLAEMIRTEDTKFPCHIVTFPGGHGSIQLLDRVTERSIRVRRDRA